MLEQTRIKAEKECLNQVLIPDLVSITLDYSWNLSLFCFDFVINHFESIRHHYSWFFQPKTFLILCQINPVTSVVFSEKLRQTESHGCTCEEFLTNVRYQYNAECNRQFAPRLNSKNNNLM